MVQMTGADYEQRRRTDAFPNLFAMVATSSDLFIAQVYTGLSAGRSLTGAKVADPALDKLVDQVYVTLDEQKQDSRLAPDRRIGVHVAPNRQPILAASRSGQQSPVCSRLAVPWVHHGHVDSCRERQSGPLASLPAFDSLSSLT